MSDLNKYRHGAYDVTTLSTLLDKYNMHSFNDGQRHYNQLLRIGADAWKKMRLQALRGFVERIIWVDQRTNTAPIPVDHLRQVSCSWIDDCGKYHAMEYAREKVLAEDPPKPKGCGCSKCNCTSQACSAVNTSVMTEEDVDLNGTIYKKIIKTRLQANGDLFRETSEPFVIKNSAGDFVVTYRLNSELVEKVTVAECGCVEDTEINKQKCFDLCGCPVELLMSNGYGHCQKPEGSYKLDKDKGLIRIFNCAPKKIAYRFVTNGEECGKEIMIPEYAEDALMNKIFFGSIRFRLNVPAYQVTQAERRANDAVDEMLKFLNPIDWDALKRLQNFFPQW